MSFIFWPLLGGLVLAGGVPVVIHLLMRQRPKRLIFPALRFLQEGRKHTTSMLKLRHLLLLAARIVLLCLLVFALARPVLNHAQLGLQGDQPVAAIVIIDTTPSMEYSIGGKSRLDDAKARARQLLDELPSESRVAILDTSEQLEEWSPTLALARSRLDELQIVHAKSRARRTNGSVTRQIAAAYRMFARLKKDEPQESLSPLLVVFSDRTRACWDASDVQELKRPDAMGAVFVDVGVDTASDLAVTDLVVANDRHVPQLAFLPGQAIHFGVTIEASPGDDSGKLLETEVHFRLTSEKQADVQSVSLRPGNRQVVWFKRPRSSNPADALGPGQYQAEVQLVPGDNLPFNDVRFATFAVRDSRPVLVLADEKSDADFWKFDAERLRLFRCDVFDVHEAQDWAAEKFDSYSVICLVNVTNPAATGLWGKLADWVDHGGGLVVVPGGEGWIPDLKGYSDADALKLLPGAFEKDEPIKVLPKLPGIAWEKDLRHPMLKLLREWQNDDQLIFNIEGQEPRVIGYWAIKPQRDENIVVRYDDADRTPAILERSVGQGRVIMLTTSFDLKKETGSTRYWTNYNAVYFAPIFEALLLQYLAGESEEPSFNHLPGAVVPVVFPVGSPELSFTLLGPGLSNAERAIQRSSVKQLAGEIDQAVTPGNYHVVELDREGQPHTFGAFSINSDPRESKLARVDVADIEKVLGPRSVVPVKYSDDLLEVLNERWPEPVELLPYIMILVLLLFAAENVFSNLFYRRDDRVLGEPKPAQIVAPEAAVEVLPVEDQPVGRAS